MFNWFQTFNLVIFANKLAFHDKEKKLMLKIYLLISVRQQKTKTMLFSIVCEMEGEQQIDYWNIATDAFKLIYLNKTQDHSSSLCHHGYGKHKNRKYPQGLPLLALYHHIYTWSKWLPYLYKFLYRRFGLKGVFYDLSWCFVILHKRQVTILHSLTRKLKIQKQHGNVRNKCVYLLLIWCKTSFTNYY